MLDVIQVDLRVDVILEHVDHVVIMLVEILQLVRLHATEFGNVPMSYDFGAAAIKQIDRVVREDICFRHDTEDCQMRDLRVVDGHCVFGENLVR